MTSADIQYIVSPIAQSEDELRAALEHPEYVQEKVVGLKPGSRRMLEVLASRIALKTLCGGEEKRVEYDVNGAPHLADGGSCISISHTAGYVAVAMSPHAVGIDVEQRGRRVQRVVQRFLTDGELAVMRQASAGDEALYVLALHLAWSAKEAAFKVLGQDYYDLQHLTQIGCMDWEQRLMTMGVSLRTDPLVIHFDYTPQYVMAWVIDPKT